ncbi:hypothetical protein, partial [Dokdonella sp.]|uniref:hypothetical protein n=1 Tax=Dokdonella sp. TaxID=2291710 RepID=UPI002F42EA14
RIDGGGSGTVDAGWTVAADGWISALACDAHGVLYVGGYFTRVAGVARPDLAAIAGKPWPGPRHAHSLHARPDASP